MNHRRTRSESGISRKGPNRKAAAQRMIRFMSNQSGGGDEEDDLDLDPPLIGGGNAARPPLPMATSPMRSPMRSSPGGRRPLLGSRTPQPFRSSRTRSMDQSKLSRAPFSSQSNQALTSGVPGENQSESRKDKRGSTNYREPGNQRPASVLQDELDYLLEENECLLQKLRFAEESIEELEVRARQLEKQDSRTRGIHGSTPFEQANMKKRRSSATKGDCGCPLTGALQGVQQTYGTEGTGNEVELLRIEAESARDVATSASEQLKYVACEVNSLRTMTQRTMVTQEEMVFIQS